jgi:Putative peptidoglycan binding domain
MNRQSQWLFEAPLISELSEQINYSNFESVADGEALTTVLRSLRFRSDSRLQAAANNRPPMRQGERGRAVQTLQKALIDLKFPMPISTRRHGSPDGIYGFETTATVRKFQQKYGLKVDGVVGRNTMSRLDRLFTSVPPANREPLCGIPPGAIGMPKMQMFESTSFESTKTASKKKAIQSKPNLCFYQAGNKSSDFFANQANRWANRIKAIVSPSASGVCQVIGATPYQTGEDIIRAINETFRCLNQPLKEVHIFSHSFPEGVIGDGNCVGLYREVARSTCSTIASNGRTVSQIPISNLAQDVVFVLHGCKTAVDCSQDADNFARDLFRYLAANLENPRVYGHPVSVCAGQKCTWCEYSNKHSNGRRLTTIPSVYDGNGFCGDIC